MNAPAIDDSTLRLALDDIVPKLDVFAQTEPVEMPRTAAEKRMRRASLDVGGNLASVTLERSDGVLRWSYRRPPRKLGPRRAAQREVRRAGAATVHEFRFQEIPPNRIIERLQKLDAWLNPDNGLWRRRPPAKAGDKWTLDAVDPKLPAVLLIHGTFSKSQMFFDTLGEDPAGRKLLESLAAGQRQLLTFDHPTVSVSPVLNALDLQHALAAAGYAGEVDIVCHSRGGLVAAWWLRLTQIKVRHVVFVGAPLQGTSLAAPSRIQATLDYLANFAGAIGGVAKAAGTIVTPLTPFLGAAAGLMGIFGGVLQTASHSSFVDAGVVLLPGLHAQSRVENNQELLRLHAADLPGGFKPFAILSNFEPATPDAPIWKFWKRWANPTLRLANKGADLLFDRANDLVVDNDCMTRIARTDIPKGDLLEFATSDQVHHCNYFVQARTVEKLGDWLKR